ncbi:hypothetical protein DSCO28_33360 [Desulfosarcina ovata subsp. sediminis]|uniref:Oligogalacturonate lyase domain-containing protein n=1 Tax=Desulfosarcina ovata subsp. sediminis TaxID=885957 RepID=A0A5K7ZR52_9BACT|nr:hypothetical protein [Desulfosarcina ovata]BBO82770.1 hypothetical protein DSCO28_33360 [Desulfosarcina ovata subsp. sediminis]
MDTKQRLKKILGDQNTERLSALKTSVQVSVNRGLRSFRGGGDSIKAPLPTIQKYSAGNVHTFFGYYDISPFSLDNQRLLAMATAFAEHRKSTRKDIRVGYFERGDPGQFVPIGRSTTWCWQMGCRLQWLPSAPNRCIFYNTLVDGAYGSVVQDVITKEIHKRYHVPVYVLDATGKRALSLNFSRLHRLRPGYGYRNLPDTTIGRQCPEKDGVWRIDMESGRSDLIIELSQLAALDPLPSMKNAEHYVNHLSFSPSGERFMFFHLWESTGKRRNRLITSDWNGDNIRVLENEGTVSHYTWKSETELLATVHYAEMGTRYILYTDQSDLKVPIGKNQLNKDGHPSYSPKGNFLLTDTYPDKYREQHVLLMAADEDLLDAAALFSPPKFRGEVRCDLHPRWDREGRYVCVDSTAGGRRQLWVIDIATLMQN